MATTKVERKRFAVKMRRHPTEAEYILTRRLWKLNKHTRRSRPGYVRIGYSRRQVLKCGYILDFWFPASLLAVEVDGPYHQGRRQRAYDSRRDSRLAEMDIETLRFTNEQVVESIKEVMAAIKAKTKERYSSELVTAIREKKLRKRKQKRRPKMQKRRKQTIICYRG